MHITVNSRATNNTITRATDPAMTPMVVVVSDTVKLLSSSMVAMIVVQYSNHSEMHDSYCAYYQVLATGMSYLLRIQLHF